ncbi:MAG: metallophosphoesterase family protein [Prolixibacteraceae bacterium]
MFKFNCFVILRILLLLLIVQGNASGTEKESTVKSVMDRVINDLYKTTNPADLLKLDLNKVMTLFTREELQILSTRHWMFDTNVPVVVSVMQSDEQKITPFWLASSGFIKTSLTMKNNQTTYNVWQKTFGAGKVGLGVNGFENGLALHYFVSVASQKMGDPLKISNFFPDNQQIRELKEGASVYMDWDELVLQNVPEEMKGQLLLMTTRGRASDSHLVGAFRSTPYPSSSNPDQVILTWSSDPSTGIDVQWRTNSKANASTLKYRVKGTSREFSAVAEKMVMEDRMLTNDRFTHHYTAKIAGLQPGTNYQYRIATQNEWPANQAFSTAAKDDSFSFLWFGDTHFSPQFGEILKKGVIAHPDAAFFSIVGDLVSDGLNRDQWDALFQYSKETASRIPWMSVPGNHDNRAGLGAKMYSDLFSYPMNAPAGIPKEQTYSFTFKNTLFLMIDATSPIDLQSDWIEKQLAGTKAKWKIAMFHFPPYNWEEPYFDIQKAWIPLFDKYHVDMVFGGHIHYYMRSKPMKEGKVVSSYKDGTAYIISVGIPNRDRNLTEEPYAEVRNAAGHLYQYVKIDGDKLYFESVNFQDKLIDQFQLNK